MAELNIPLLAWACSPNATLQKQFAITICCPLRAIIYWRYVGPDFVGIFRGMGTGDRGRALARRTGSDFTAGHPVRAMNGRSRSCVPGSLEKSCGPNALPHTNSPTRNKSWAQLSAPIAHRNMTGDYDDPNLGGGSGGWVTKIGAGPLPLL